MREIDARIITEAVEQMCIDANCFLNGDVRAALETGYNAEKSELAKDVLGNILKNADIAAENTVPICQDTGMAVFFIKLGQDVHVVNGSFNQAINEGVRRGYQKGYLRKSVVADPIRRGNTGDNTPAVIHAEIVDGEEIEITIAPKGFGSENMSAIKMLKPSEGIEGIIDFVVDTVKNAGSNPCPPIVVGVGIGGTFEKAAYLAKSALLRDVDSKNPDPYYSDLEEVLLEKINKLDIGPQGFGGVTTALGVNVETFPTHIAGMPCAVNINCHVTRHLSKTI